MTRPDDATPRKRPATPTAAFNFSTYLPYHLTFPVGIISRVLGGAMESALWPQVHALANRCPARLPWPGIDAGIVEISFEREERNQSSNDETDRAWLRAARRASG